MLKQKYIIGLILLMIIFSQSIVFGQIKESTSSAEKIYPTSIVNSKDADKIASAIAQLREKNNKAISGFATQNNNSIIKIKNENDEEYTIKTDDILSKYYQVNGATRKEVKLQDIKKGMFLIVTGVLNDKEIIANNIYIDEMFLTKSGKITEIDKVNFTIKVVSTDKDNYVLNIENVTKQQILNVKNLAIEKTGFSKIKEGDTVHFVVKKTGEEKNNTFSAQKILIIPQEYFMQ
ncbi:MAG: hypothetical protein Q7R95_09155 [bacterium]|nr:hypothetical protein [bacterium]